MAAFLTPVVGVLGEWGGPIWALAITPQAHSWCGHAGRGGTSFFDVASLQISLLALRDKLYDMSSFDMF